MDGKLWVTRFHQRDAVCLDDHGMRIEIGIEKPHDGLVHENRLYFTTVDGRIVIVDRDTLRLDQIVDLMQIHGGNALLGWCRGLLAIGENKLWVGFTRVRKTMFLENVAWVKGILRDGVIAKPTHIALYDIQVKHCLQEFNLEEHGMNAIFGIFPAATPANPPRVDRGSWSVPFSLEQVG
jgi:hypothetical protein